MRRLFLFVFPIALGMLFVAASPAQSVAPYAPLIIAKYSLQFHDGVLPTITIPVGPSGGVFRLSTYMTAPANLQRPYVCPYALFNDGFGSGQVNIFLVNDQFGGSCLPTTGGSYGVNGVVTIHVPADSQLQIVFNVEAPQFTGKFNFYMTVEWLFQQP
jgi:hypothetical protein